MVINHIYANWDDPPSSDSQTQLGIDITCFQYSMDPSMFWEDTIAPKLVARLYISRCLDLDGQETKSSS